MPIGVQDISIVAELQTDADEATLAKLAELTERYCVVGQSLAKDAVDRRPRPCGAVIRLLEVAVDELAQRVLVEHFLQQRVIGH